MCIEYQCYYYYDDGYDDGDDDDYDGDDDNDGDDDADDDMFCCSRFGSIVITIWSRIPYSFCNGKAGSCNG